MCSPVKVLECCKAVNADDQDIDKPASQSSSADHAADRGYRGGHLLVYYTGIYYTGMPSVMFLEFELSYFWISLRYPKIVD